MRYALVTAAVAYLGLSALSADRQVFFANDLAVVACLIVAPLALGAVIGRWWALWLPLLAVLVAIPFGLPNAAEGEPFPTWFNLLFISPVLIALVAVAVGGRKLWQRRHRAKAA